MAKTKAITNVRLFDGKELSDKTTVYIDGERFAAELDAQETIDAKGAFMMPGLIDAHCHVTQMRNVNRNLKNGVTAAMTIQTPNKLKASNKMRIYSTYNRALGFVTDAKEFVETEIANGSDYIKIIIEHKPMMAKTIIRDDVVMGIVEEAHKRGKLVACHAVSVPAMELAIEAGVDIHVHVPLEATMSADMVDRIAAHRAPVVPTLAMMKGFTDIPIYGYKKQDYQNSVNCVQMLHEAGVPLMTGTDASNIIFLPWVKFGDGLHGEMQLMSAAGLSNTEILAGATSIAAESYGMNEAGLIAPGKYADFILVNGDPTANLSDIDNIKLVSVGGETVFTA